MKTLLYIHKQTLNRQTDMKPVKTITDPEAFKILADNTRRKMVFLLRAKEMTVSQIAGELALTPQTVYHHIKRLLEAQMVEVTKEVRIDHLIESYYQATAEVFHLTVGNTSKSKETLIQNIENSLNALKQIGFKIQYNQQDINQLAELSMEKDHCCSAKQYEEAISKLEDVDLFTKQEVQEFASLIAMTEDQIKEQDKIQKQFRNLLRSLIIQDPKQ
jgi:DNA-binding transcriptional ArsR family regulator